MAVSFVKKFVVLYKIEREKQRYVNIQFEIDSFSF